MDLKDFLLSVQIMIISLFIIFFKREMTVLMNHLFFLLVESFTQCLFLGYQDTLFRNCNIFYKYSKRGVKTSLKCKLSSVGDKSLLRQILEDEFVVLGFSSYEIDKFILFSLIAGKTDKNLKTLESFGNLYAIWKNVLKKAESGELKNTKVVEKLFDLTMMSKNLKPLEDFREVKNYTIFIIRKSVSFKTMDTISTINLFECEKVDNPLILSRKKAEVHISLEGKTVFHMGFEFNQTSLINIFRYLHKIEESETLASSQSTDFCYFKISHCPKMEEILNVKSEIEFETINEGKDVYFQITEKNGFALWSLLSITATVLQFMSGSKSLPVFYTYVLVMTTLSLLMLCSSQDVMKSTKVKYSLYIVLSKIFKKHILEEIYMWLKKRGSGFSFCDFRTSMPEEIENVLILCSKNNIYYESFFTFIGEVSCSSAFYPVYGVKKWYFEKTEVLIIKKDFSELENSYSLTIFDKRGRVIKNSNFTVKKEGDKGELFYTIMDQIESKYACGLSVCPSERNFGISFTHFLDPIEIMAKCQETEDLRLLCSRANKSFCFKFLSASIELKINNYLNLCKGSCFADSRDACIVAYFNCLFFGRFESDLAFNIKPNTVPLKKDFNVGNKEFKRYVSCLSDIMVKLGYKKLLCITKFKNPSKARLKTIEVMDSLAFKLDVVNNDEEMMAIVDEEEVGFVGSTLKLDVQIDENRVDNLIKNLSDKEEELNKSFERVNKLKDEFEDLSRESIELNRKTNSNWQEMKVLKTESNSLSKRKKKKSLEESERQEIEERLDYIKSKFLEGEELKSRTLEVIRMIFKINDSMMVESHGLNEQFKYCDSFVKYSKGKEISKLNTEKVSMKIAEIKISVVPVIKDPKTNSYIGPEGKNCAFLKKFEMFYNSSGRIKDKKRKKFVKNQRKPFKQSKKAGKGKNTNKKIFFKSDRLNKYRSPVWKVFKRWDIRDSFTDKYIVKKLRKGILMTKGENIMKKKEQEVKKIMEMVLRMMELIKKISKETSKEYKPSYEYHQI